MGLVNERILRLLLVLVGLGALGAFGWRIYDYWKHKDSLLQQVDIARLQEKAGGGPRVDPGHLLPYTEFAVIETLNVTGKEKPVIEGPKPPPPPVAKLSERDLIVTFIQYAGKGHPANAAYITPVEETAEENSANVPGDLYVVGERVAIKSKKDLEVRVKRIGEVEVLVGYGQGEGAGELTLTIAAYDLPQGTASSLLGNPESADPSPSQLRTVPDETRLNDSGEFEVGSADVAYFEKLSQEEIVAAVPVRPDRDRLSNEIRGLRIQSVPENSPFSRLGLRADDVVLEVNGTPALNRDDLLRAMRATQVTTLEVKIERVGAVRTLRYRLP